MIQPTSSAMENFVVFYNSSCLFSIFELDSLFEPTQRLSSLENRANLIVQDSVDLWQLFHDKRKWVFIISVLHFSRFCKLSLATNNQHLATRDHVSIVQNSVLIFQIFGGGCLFCSFLLVLGKFREHLGFIFVESVIPHITARQRKVHLQSTVRESLCGWQTIKHTENALNPDETA